MTFRSFTLVIVTALILASFFIFPSQINKTPTISTSPYEFWEIHFHGKRTDLRCSSTSTIDGVVHILLTPSLSEWLLKSQVTTTQNFAAQATLEMIEQFGKKPAERLFFNRTATTLASQISDQQKQIKINLLTETPLFFDRCKTPSDPQGHSLEFNAQEFADNAIKGQWNYGTFEMRWVSGGPSAFPIQGPMETRVLAGSNNATVSWRHFPGAQSYKVDIFKNGIVQKENLQRTVNALEDYTIITDLDSHSAYAFVVSAIVANQEITSNHVLFARPGTAIKATEVQAGNDHACALLLDKKVICWGANSQGQIGDNSKTTFSLPVPVAASGPVQALHVEGDQTCVQTQNGEQCWGSPSLSPRQNIIIKESVAQKAAGEDFTCFQRPDRRLKCLGANQYGQLALPLPVPTTEPVEPPYFVTDSLKEKSISAGKHFACVINSESRVLCWGENQLGQLGSGSGNSSAIPQSVRY